METLSAGSAYKFSFWMRMWRESNLPNCDERSEEVMPSGNFSSSTRGTRTTFEFDKKLVF